MSDSGAGVRIVIDAMGGDNAPGVNVKGALLALRESPDIELTLVGQEPVLQEELRKEGLRDLPERLRLQHADDVISMDDHAAAGLRRKRDSSIQVGLRMVKDGKADAFISAGHSGAVMASALLVLGRLPGVERPAILIRIPTADGDVIILDGGANVDCRPSHLVQFAEMGHIYAKYFSQIEKPRIGVLSNGSEDSKGNELTRETHLRLKEHGGIHYIGYVEGYDIFGGSCDVVVCDGFVGNVVLKLAEGLAGMMRKWFRKEIYGDPLGMAGALLMQRVMKRFKNRFDYEPYGAAPLVGIDGIVMISHGSSTEIAIKSGIMAAKRSVEERLLEKMKSQVTSSAARDASVSRGQEGA